jgi:hypothetical protein
VPLTETIGDGRESVRKIRADQAHGGNDDERDQAEVTAERSDGADDGDGDQTGDETIFDGDQRQSDATNDA